MTTVLGDDKKGCRRSDTLQGTASDQGWESSPDDTAHLSWDDPSLED